MKRMVTSVLALTCFTIPLAQAADAQRTVFLAASVPPAAGLNITWHAAQQKYYAVGPGSGEPMYSRVYVFSPAGAELQAFTEIELDVRSVNYNPTSNKIEVITFTARDGGVGSIGNRPQGLFEVTLDGAGLVTGPVTQALSPLPGLLGRQTMPVLDPARNELYSFSNTNQLRRVSRVDGSQLGSITLDTAAAGNPSTTWFGIGFDTVNDYLVVTSFGPGSKAYRFRLDGSYVDNWNLDVEVSQFYGGASVANGQFFVFDPARDGWQGYSFVGAPACDAIDFNGDGLFPDDQDLVDFLSVLAGGACSTGTCNDIDFNNDGLFPDDNDLVAFLTVLAGGDC